MNLKIFQAINPVALEKKFNDFFGEDKYEVVGSEFSVKDNKFYLLVFYEHDYSSCSFPHSKTKCLKMKMG